MGTMNWLRLTTLVLVLTVLSHGIFGQAVQPSGKQTPNKSAATTPKTASPQVNMKVLTKSDKFLALINYIRNYPGRVSGLLRKPESRIFCRSFKDKSCKRLSFDLRNYRQIPKIWPSAELFKRTKNFVDANYSSFDKTNVTPFMEQVKKDLNLTKIKGDCFNYLTAHLSALQRVYTYILNKPQFQYANKQRLIKVVFNKLSDTILPEKYRTSTIQKHLGRKLQAIAKKPKKVFPSDRLIGGFHVKETPHGKYGCLFVGTLVKAGAKDVKSPYNSEQNLALEQYNKDLDKYFAKENITNRMKFKQILARDKKNKAAWAKQLKKQAAIDVKKKPEDPTPHQRLIYKHLTAKIKKVKPILQA